MDKRVVYIAISLGGFIGGYVPVIFGVSAFSLWSLVGGFFGSLFGIYAVHKWLS